MTSSDNVLRLGLTSKEIAIDDALRAIRTDRHPEVLTGQGPKAPPGAPFAVTMGRGVGQRLDTGRYRVVIAIDGPVSVLVGAAVTELGIGQAVLVPAADPAIDVSSEAMVAIVEAVGSVRAS